MALPDSDRGKRQVSFSASVTVTAAPFNTCYIQTKMGVFWQLEVPARTFLDCFIVL